jgi:hypothetical protein
MTSSTRFWIGGGGAMLPLLVTLLAVDLGPLIDHPSALSIGTYVGAAIRYIVLFAIGGIVAALNSDEVQPVKLVQLGIAAPALISTYVNAQPPKQPVGQPPSARVSMYSFDLVSSAHAAGPAARDDGRSWSRNSLPMCFERRLHRCRAWSRRPRRIRPPLIVLSRTPALPQRVRQRRPREPPKTQPSSIVSRRQRRSHRFNNQR